MSRNRTEIGLSAMMIFLWTLGLVALRLIAARRYEREEAERALDALEHRIRRGRSGLPGIWWRRLIARSGHVSPPRRR